MQVWKTLVNTALLGTEKRGSVSAAVQAETGIPPGERPDAESAFLQDLALLSAFRKGGVQALQHEIPTRAVEPEARPYASAAATAALAETLSPVNLGLLELWLRRATDRGLLIPARYLDSVLDATSKAFRLHPLLREAGGARGAWLATMNPQWEYLRPKPSGDGWEHGTSLERAAFLQGRRAESPGQGRALLESVWAQEPADQRERLLGTLATGLSLDDLTFLESAATDKSKRVAAQAAELLLQLRDSSLVRRFETWIRAAVRVRTDRKLLGLVTTTKLEIGSPEMDPELQSLIGKKPSGGISDTAFRTQAACGFVPPEFWEAHLQTTPEKALDILSNEAPELFPGVLAAAASRFGSRPWALLLAERASQFYPLLLPLLDAPAQRTYLERFLATRPELVLEFYDENEVEWHSGHAQQLLQYIASDPYKYSKAYLNAKAWQIPVSAREILDLVAPVAQPSSPPYLRDYAMQVWPATRLQLRDALDIKARILNAFN